MTRYSHEETMAAKYAFPYHHLAQADGSRWKIHRTLQWGHEYLGYLTAVVDEVKKRSPGPVLELGCGDGRLIAELIKNGITNVTGVDVDERAVLFARAFNYGSGAAIVAGDIRQLDSHGFRIAVAMEVLEHIPDNMLPEIVGAVWKRLAPGATFIVTVPTTNVPVTPAHFRHYDAKLLASHLEPYFEIETVRYMHRPGVAASLLQRAYLNRLFVLNHAALIRLVANVYRSKILPATSMAGAHLLAVAKRRDTLRGGPGNLNSGVSGIAA